MRILIDGRHLTQEQPSGVGEYTVEILRALFRLDQANTYVILTTGRKPMAENRLGTLPSNVVIRHVAIPNKILTLGLSFCGRPYLDRLAGGSFDLAFLPNIAVARLSPGLPYILTMHDMTWKIFPSFYSTMMRFKHALARPDRLAVGASMVLTPSSHARRDTIRLLDLKEDHVCAVPHGLTQGFGAHPEATDHGVRSRYHLPKRFALFLGTHEPRKNIIAMINAVAVYRRETQDDLRLVLAGPWGWNTKELRRRLAQSDAHAFVHRIGPVSATDRPGLYRLATLFLWPSMYEGFGLPVLEAMASGTPVITSHTSSLPELTHGAAILVNPFDPAEITAALKELVSSPALAVRLRMAGIRRSQMFSWDQTAQTVLNVFKHIFGHP